MIDKIRIQKDDADQESKLDGKSNLFRKILGS
jgi:hypothetical protein